MNVPGNVRMVVPNGVYGLMVVPPCPHEGCGWFMPQLSCPAHGNFDMTFLAYRNGALTHVRAVLGLLRPPVPAAWGDGAGVRACPPPATTDQEV